MKKDFLPISIKILLFAKQLDKLSIKIKPNTSVNNEVTSTYDFTSLPLKTATPILATTIINEIINDFVLISSSNRFSFLMRIPSAKNPIQLNRLIY